jgi:hypothetical protein
MKSSSRNLEPGFGVDVIRTYLDPEAATLTRRCATFCQRSSLDRADP